MKVGIFMHPYGESKPSGLGVFGSNLVSRIIKEDADTEYVLLVREAPRVKPVFALGCREIVLNKSFARLSSREIRSYGLDRCLFLTPVLPLLAKLPPTIVVVHDLAYRTVPSESWIDFLYKLVFHWIYFFSTHKASVVVAVSDATKQDAVKAWRLKADKIKVIYNGPSGIHKLPPKLVQVKRPYFLFVGVFKPRKNVLKIVEEFGRFKKKIRSDFNLVLVGAANGRYAKRVRSLIKEAGLTDSVFLLGYRSEEELSYLYRNGYAFLYPSMGEGFGVTVLDALSCGLPCVVSRIPVFQELYKGVALVVDENSFAANMERLATDTNLRNKLAATSQKFSFNFSWSKSARQMIELIHRDYGH